MNSQRDEKHFRLTIKLDYERDADLLAWLETIPRGLRSEEVRQALRDGIEGRETIDLQAIRSVFAEELDKALEGKHIGRSAEPETISTNLDVEQKYGDKLDRMLGGLQSQFRGDEGELRP